MEFRRIEYFLVLADKLNYAEAAKELCISSPALTKQIHILEDELGAKLFDRTTRSVKLTEIGVMCNNQFSNVKAQYDATLAAVEKTIRSLSRVVRIGFFAALPRDMLLAPVIHALTAQFSEIDFEVSTNSMYGLKTQLLNGDVDLVFTNKHEFETWTDCDLITFKTIPAQIVVSPKHKWIKENKKQISIQDMEEADILLLIKNGPYEPNSFYGRVRTKSRTFTPDFYSMMIELEKGKHFSVIPMFFSHSEYSNLIAFDLPEQYRFFYSTICACNSSVPNKYVRDIFSFIKENQKTFTTKL